MCVLLVGCQAPSVFFWCLSSVPGRFGSVVLHAQTASFRPFRPLLLRAWTGSCLNWCLPKCSSDQQKTRFPWNIACPKRRGLRDSGHWCGITDTSGELKFNLRVCPRAPTASQVAQPYFARLCCRFLIWVSMCEEVRHGRRSSPSKLFSRFVFCLVRVLSPPLVSLLERKGFLNLTSKPVLVVAQHDLG